jgi:FSR family fosmidomycin resistance protein-like MFS transporter
VKKQNGMKRLSLAALAAGHLVGDSYGSFLPALLPLLMQRHGFGLKEAGGLAAVAAFSSHFLQPVWGYFADRWPGRQFAIGGPLLMALCISSIGLAPSPVFLVLALALGGCGMAAFHPQAATLARQASGARHSLGIALFISAGSLGFAVGPVLATGLVSVFGLPGTVGAIVPALVISVLLLWLVPSPQPKASDTGRKEDPQPDGLPLLPMVGLSVVSILRALVSVAFINLLPILFARQGLELAQGGARLTLFLLSGALGGVLAGYASERFGVKSVTGVTLVLSTPFLLLTVWSAGWMQGFALVMGGGLLMSSHPINVSWAQSLAPHRSGTASALTIGLAFGAAGLLMPFVGALGELVGVAGSLAITAGIAVVAALLVIPIPAAPTDV